MESVRKRHDAQKAARDNDTNSEDRGRFLQSWLDESTVDAWRHDRMLSMMDPLWEAYPGATWLTIGDGRFAYETRYILRHDPGADVMTTDISEPIMRQAQERGLIQKYSTENCESLSFSDHKFDFVLCKESYHHFPRPYMALYEMLRVAKLAVVLLEPSDVVLSAKHLREYEEIKDGHILMKDIVRALLRRMGVIPLLRRLRGFAPDDSKPDVACNFEESGNFVYTISERELEKVALGIGMPVVAFKVFSDYYEEGVEFEKAVPGSVLFQKTQDKIAEAECNGANGMLSTILFHLEPGNLRSGLVEHGYRIVDIPQNPYMS